MLQVIALVPTQFVYGPGGILQERQGSTWTAAYTYGNALLRRNAEVPLYDALGSERTVTDGSGSVTGSIAYEAFGQAVATNGSSSSPYTFAATSGYRNDGDAGLTHVGARYYDAQAGRFITRDTELDQHPYLYCGHDPVNALDPSGHEGICPDPVAIGELLGQISTIVRTVMPIPQPIQHWTAKVPVPIDHSGGTIIFPTDPKHPIQPPIFKYHQEWKWGDITVQVPTADLRQTSISIGVKVGF